MKFDCIIMNPPYGNSKRKTSYTLHYDITFKCINQLSKYGQCISLMPTSILKIYNSKNNKKINALKTQYNPYIESIIEIDGTKYFDTAQQIIGIYNFYQTKTHKSINICTLNKNENVKSLLDFNYFSNEQELNILNKIHGNYKSIFKTKAKVVYGHGEDKTNLSSLVDEYMSSPKIKNNDYFIFVSYANGGVNAQWQSPKLKNYGIVDKDKLEEILLTNTKSKTILAFKQNEVQSAKNIIKLLNCNCLKFGLSKLQYAQTMSGKVYYAFPDIDYTNIDTEEKFYKFFNITKEEQKIIEESLEKYLK